MTSTTHRLVARRRRGLSFVAAVAALLCLLGGVALASSDPADARPHSLRTGPGRHVGTDFIGSYLLPDGTRVFCLSPRRATPRTVHLHAVTRYPGLSASASAALAYALSTWGRARTRDAAAVESQVLNTLAGNHADVARRARHLPASLRRLTGAHVRQARALRGPYRVSVALPVAPLPGQSGTGTVRVVSGAGHPVPGLSVQLRASANVALPRSIRTGPRGTARFGYRAVTVGAARVQVRITGPATSLRVTSPRAREQRLAAAGPPVGTTAVAAYRATPAGVTHRYSCSSDCDGRPEVTLTACAAARTVASRVVYRAGNLVVARDFAASPRRHCIALTVPISDGARVQATWQYRVRGRWSVPVAAPGTFVVDCPAAPAVTVTVVHDCVRAVVSVQARPALRPTLLSISGGRRATVTAAAGRAATWAVSAPCGSALPITVRSGVLRRSGGWNLGPAMSVRTP